MRLKDIIISWDTGISLVLSTILFFLLPKDLNINFSISFFNIGITVLSIVFPLFFAALAMIISSSDNDFILFLEEENDFTDLIQTFKFTLYSLMISLIYAISLSVISNYGLLQIECKKNEIIYQNKWFFVIFVFLFTYSFFATILSIKDIIMYSQMRNKFLSKNNSKKDSQS